MSLEQALAENTATMKQLIAVLSTAVESGGVSAPAGDTSADTATDTAADGTKRKRRTKAEIEADNAAAAAPAASTATPPATTTGAADAPTMQSITAKLMAIHKRDGNPGVKPILDQFGVTAVPQLAQKNLVEVDAAVEAALNPPSDASLFG